MPTLLTVPNGHDIVLFGVSNTASATINRSTSGLRFTDGTTVYLNSTGLGVGMAPSYALDVSGSMRASGQIISSVTTGTAPFVVSSTTRVTNLNADLLDDQSGAYYLSLGNATGNLAFSALPTGSGTWDPGSTNTVTLTSHAILGGTLAIGTTQNLNRGLRVGISTGPASGTATYGLDVSVTRTNAVGASNWAGVMVGGTFNAAGATADDWRALWVNNATVSNGSLTTQYGLYVDNLTSGGTNWAVYTAGTTPSYFGGNVGIGMTPGYALDVSGGARISGGLGIGPNGATSSRLYVHGTIATGAWQYGVYLYATASSNLATSGVINLYVAGTTASAASPLTIPNLYGAWITPPTKGTNISANYGYSAYIPGSSVGASANYTLYLGGSSGGTNNYTLYAATGTSCFGGPVGFGTATPAATVDVNGTTRTSILNVTSTVSVTGTITSNSVLAIANGDTGGGGSLRFKDVSGNNSAAIYQANNGWFYIDFGATACSGLVFRGPSSATIAGLSRAGQFALPVTGSAGGIVFGGDTNLYQSAANTLKTDDDLVVAAGLTIGTNNASTTNVPVRLYTTSLSATAASITISSIPGGYSALLITIACRCDNAVAYNTLLMRCNGDTGANYDYKNNWGGGVVHTNAQTSCQIGYATGANAPASSPGIAEILIPAYDKTTFHKDWGSKAGFRDGDGSGGSYLIWGQWRSTSAITSITLLPSAGSFIAGTVVTVYGIT